jgi:hypothetical protein
MAVSPVSEEQFVDENQLRDKLTETLRPHVFPSLGDTELEKAVEQVLGLLDATVDHNDGVALGEMSALVVPISSEDLSVEVFRRESDPLGQGGAGIRLIHLPSGVTVEAAENNSRLQNQADALAELYVRLAG